MYSNVVKEKTRLERDHTQAYKEAKSSGQELNSLKAFHEDLVANMEKKIITIQAQVDELE